MRHPFFRDIRVAVLCCIIILSCEPDQREDPLVITLDVVSLSEVQPDAVIAASRYTFNRDVAELNDYGFVYSTSQNVTLDNGIVVSKLAAGAPVPFESANTNFSDTIRSLRKATTYYIRAYARDKQNTTALGPEASFSTGEGDVWVSAGMNSFPGPAAYFHSRALVGSSIYIAGGTQYISPAGEADVRNNYVYKYDLEKSVWTRLADFPGWVDVGVFESIGDRLYLVASNNETWEYDISQDRWTQKADRPVAGMELSIGFAISNKLYTGYSTDAQQFNDWWSFDPADASDGIDEHGQPLGKWTQLSDIPVIDRSLKSEAFTHNGKGYLYAGNFNAPIYEFSPPDTWIELTTFPGENKSDPGSSGGEEFAFAVGNKIYLAPGRTSEGKMELWSFDLITNTWDQLPSVPPYAHFVKGFSYNNKGFVLSQSYNLYRYIP